MMISNRRRPWLASFYMICFILIAGVFGVNVSSTEALAAQSGRYTEQEIETSSAVENFEAMFPLEDGGYALWGKEVPVRLVHADGSVKEISDTWKRMSDINLGITGAVSPAGEQIYVYFPKLSEAEYEELGEKLTPYAYYFVDKSGRKHILKPYGDFYSEETQLEYFEFLSNGELFVSDICGKVFHMNTETGEMRFLFQANSQIYEFELKGEYLLALDETKAWIYNLEKEVLLEDNTVLNDFVGSHQVKGKSIAMCPDPEDENILYFACRTGLYRYVWEGSMLEQIADGQFLSMGNSYYEIQSIQAVEKVGFRMFFTPGHLVEIYFDETLSSEPEKTLYIYSLEDDERIRYAAALFGKQHPEVYVKYETGMAGDYAVSKEDALKNLNTKLLSGEGPDVLVMDGMDIEQYAEKGILKDLESFLQKYLEQGLLYENIVEAMRLGDEEKIYALPMTVKLMVWCGERNIMEGEENLADIVEGFRNLREQLPTGAMMFLRNEEELLRHLIPVCLPTWKTGEGLDEHMLLEFFQSAKAIWDINAEGMSEEDWDIFRQYDGEIDIANEYYWNMNNAMICAMGVEHVWENFVYIRSAYPPWGISFIETLQFNLDLMGKQCELWFDSLQGQAEHVFIGNTITGINAYAKEEELAEEFLKLLLSEELMRKWWMNTGIPITRAEVQRCMDINNFDYVEYAGIHSVEAEKSTGSHQERFWPSEEIQEQFLDIMGKASTIFFEGTELENIVVETGINVLKDEITAEAAVEEVKRHVIIGYEE